MILYHGSNVEIGRIDLSLSKVGKDFGCGFYLWADKEQARELAERKTEQLGTGVPTLNVYEFNTECLGDNSLRILEFRTYSKEWAEFVLKNGVTVHACRCTLTTLSSDRLPMMR